MKLKDWPKKEEVYEIEGLTEKERLTVIEGLNEKKVLTPKDRLSQKLGHSILGKGATPPLN